MILLRVKKCPWSSTVHFPEEILRGLAASTTLLFLPLPCTPLLSLQSVEDRWAGTYPRPGCFFHPPECRPEGSPGGREGLQKVRVCSCFWPLRMAFMERRVLTDMFTPQLMGKNKREEGVWKWRIWGQPCAMWNLITLLSCFCLYVCICSVTQSHLTLWDPKDCRPPGSSVLLLSALVRMPRKYDSKLDSVCGLVRKENVILHVEFCAV